MIRGIHRYPPMERVIYGIPLADLLRDFDDGPDNRLRRVGRRGKNLKHADLSALHPDAVGKGAAGIDGNVERQSSWAAWHRSQSGRVTSRTERMQVGRSATLQACLHLP